MTTSIDITLDPNYHLAIERLRELLEFAESDDMLGPIIAAKEEVLDRYQPCFTLAGISNLTAEQFLGFLLFRNNHHWTGLQRMGPAIVGDMDRLKAALNELLDESVPISHRLDSLLPGGKARVLRLGKAVLTPILLIAHPDRYGVWNGTSEGALRNLGLWHGFDRKASVGERYERLMGIFLQLARDLGTDLWTLDSLWWRVVNEVPEPEKDNTEGLGHMETPGVRFGLERHLHDFLLDNWDNTDLGQEWQLDEEGGDIKGYGYERVTSIGRIDLLARHRKEPRWLVIELKRGQTSDDTLGQVQRYMGWVQEELASESETVGGLIIAHDSSERLRYALKAAGRVRFMRYEVDFRLEEG